MNGIHLFHLAVLICVVVCGLVAYGFRAAKLRGR